MMAAYVQTNSAPVDYNFLPYGHEFRIDLTKLSNNQITEAVLKTSSVFKQEIILHDLLISGMKMETPEQRGMVSLAAELYLKLPVHTRQDFLFHLTNARKIFKIFAGAMFINTVFHESQEEGMPGSSGLTKEELAKEKAAALNLEKYTKHIV